MVQSIHEKNEFVIRRQTKIAQEDIESKTLNFQGFVIKSTYSQTLET